LSGTLLDSTVAGALVVSGALHASAATSTRANPKADLVVLRMPFPPPLI
jgi:hypothetical protein